MELPEIAIRTSFFANDRCAICGCDWGPVGPDPVDAAIPAAYTVESIESGDPPQVVCDHCVEQHYPETFAELLEERQRFRRE